MSDFVLLDNDIVNFIAAFGVAVVTVKPGALKASGPPTSNGQKVCLDGDEGQVQVPGCAYVTVKCTIPGTGTLKISALASDQKTTKTKSGGKAVLLKGSQFSATFDVQTPAQQPSTPNPIPDAMTQYAGHGTFTTTNTKFRAT